MSRRRDPVEAGDDGSRDLYEISRWEVRSGLDRLSVKLYALILAIVRWVIIGAALFILVAQFALGGVGLVTDPVVGAFVVLSIVPAFLLAAYVWYADVTTNEPLELLVGAFALGLLFASFAGILNPVIGSFVSAVGSGLGMFPILGGIAFFFLVVGPVEEGVKMLAVRLHPYRSDAFDAVIDGAVYGAAAGLGFATIENALYITRAIENLAQMTNLIGAGSGIATVRALAGPGHVIYSAFAGYYLGLAKFNPEQAGPIVIKGIIIASLIHGAYNTSVTFLVPAAATVLGIGQMAAFFGFVVLYDGLFGYLLIRKLAAYKVAYRETRSSAEGEVIAPDRTEFE